MMKFHMMFGVIIASIASPLLPASHLGAQLRTAIEQNNFAEAKKIIGTHGVDVNAADPTHGFTPLMLASYRGLYDISRMLIEAHANVNATSKRGETALMYAAEQNRQDITLLLESKARTDIVDLSGRTAEQYAKLSDRNEIIGLLNKFKNKSPEQPNKHTKNT